MTSNEHTHDQEPSTPKQAQDLLTEIGELTTLQGKNYGDRNTFGIEVPEMPSEVVEHLPELRDPSNKIEDSVYITQIFDRETGQPLLKGEVGIVTFTRKERVDEGLMYAAHANYHIKSADGETYNLERHVTNTEHGWHKVREAQGQMRRASTDASGFALEMLENLLAKKRNLEATRPIEKAMGMFDVSKNEAQQVIDFVHGLNNPE